jgi:diguanylate cyclase (GGDEF)-like protein/PAS domain S-box-containing protein
MSTSAARSRARRPAGRGAVGVIGFNGSSEALIRALTTHAPLGVFIMNAAGECEYANDRLSELTGLTAAQALGSGWTAALHPEDAQRVTNAWAKAAATGRDFTLEYRFRRPDGSVAWVEGSASVVRDEGGALVGWVGVCVDLTARKLTEERYHELFDNARDAVFTADTGGSFTSVNRAANEITGFSRDELLAMNVFDLIAPEDVERARASLARSFAGDPDDSIELQLVAKEGHRVVVEVAGRVIEESGRPVGLEGIARDVTTQHALQAELAHQALHDALTGLPNRVLLVDRLSQALARAERPDSQVAVMLLDLDNFKLVNDSLGHAIGDELLTAIAPRLLQTMRSSDTVGRLGGDEFAFVLEVDGGDREVIAVAERVLSVFEEPFTAGSGTQRIGASLGIALGAKGDSPDGLLRNADTAMYRAKAARRGSFELFDDAMHRRVLRELAVKNALADALQDGVDELLLYYQPIVSLADGEVLGIEALVRWLHPQWGWVAPNEFIRLAEADTLITSLGRYVLTAAIRQAAQWRIQLPETLPLGVSVNVSPCQLAEPDFVPFLTTTLDRHGLAPPQLGIEVTERVFIDERDNLVAENLSELAQIGVPLSLDDFGTGYSALASLSRFPFAALKIDRYFIRSIRNPTDPAPITTAIVSLGQALGLTVIAEGVENEVQADYLERLGCDAVQGYYYARPLPAAELTAYLGARTDGSDMRARADKATESVAR